MSRAIIILLVLNIISCFVARKIHGGRMVIDLPKEKHIAKDSTKVLILLAGVLSQPLFAYGKLPSVTRKSLASDATIFAKFSNFGWSSKKAAEQLDEAIRQLYADEVEVYTLSVSDKVVRQMDSTKITKIFAINPCPTPEVLSEKHSRLMPPNARAARIVVFLLGWIAVLPLVKANEGRYSLALIADQAWEIGLNDKVEPTKAYKTYLVLSDQDELVDNQAVVRYFGGLHNVYSRTSHIETKHGRLASRKCARLYDEALISLDSEVEKTEDIARRKYLKVVK